MISTPISAETVSRETGIQAVRPGTPESAILGIVPAVVAHPESASELASAVAWANKERLKVTATGAGSKLDRGNAPERCDLMLSTARLSRIKEHAAGDMTATVEAGVMLAELQVALAREGQFLAVDPPVPGSIGGLIATADSGYRRLRYGGVRDLLLGITFVRADGVVAKGGGKVVKNVAGYDLPKLLTGSLGTLGVIIEATFRLYPIAPSTVSVVAPVGIGGAGKWAALVMRSLVPTAIDYFRDQSGASTAAVRFEGTERAVRSQAERAVEMLGAGHSEILDGDSAEAFWSALNAVTATNDADVLARVISVPADLPALLTEVMAQADNMGVAISVRAHMGHGQALVRWHEPSVEAARTLVAKARTEADVRSSNLVVWRAPLAVRSRIDVWGDAGEGLSLMRSVKGRFDPNGTLNAGRFVGGI